MEDKISFFSLRRNLSSLYLVKVAKWMNLVMPIIVLFYKSNGMSMQDIFTLQAVYSFTLMVFEIPTGYFADTAGRRTSILIGSVFGFGGYLIYSLSAGFWQFAVAETILGCGMNLVSGADSAMLYDSLMSAGKSGKYTRYEGRISSIGNSPGTQSSQRSQVHQPLPWHGLHSHISTASDFRFQCMASPGLFST